MQSSMHCSVKNMNPTGNSSTMDTIRFVRFSIFCDAPQRGCNVIKLKYRELTTAWHACAPQAIWRQKLI